MSDSIFPKMSLSSRSLPSAFLLACALTAQPVDAQPTPASSFGERVDVEVVNVEVYVTDSKGGGVSDLEPEDFRVFEDGREVEVSHFSYVDLGLADRQEAPSGFDTTPPARTGAEPVTPQDGLRLVVFIDDVHAGPSHRGRLLSQLWTLLEERLQPRDEVMLIHFDGRVKVLLPLSRDRKALFNQIRDVALLGAGRLQGAQEEDRVLEAIYQQQRLAMESSRSVAAGMEGVSVGATGIGEPCTPNLGYMAKSHAESVFHRSRASLEILSAVIDSLAHISGPKALIHVSDGIPLQAGAAAYMLAIELCDGTAAAQGDPNGFDIRNLGSRGDTTGRFNRFDPFRARIDMTRYDLTEKLREVAAGANAQRVSVYALQATGVQGYSGSGAGTQERMLTLGAENLRISNKQDSLFILADETGGRAIFNTNDFRPDLDRMLDDLRGYYLLGYTPPHRRENKVHSIRVETDRSGVRIRHRKSYRDKNAHERIVDLVLGGLIHTASLDNPFGLTASVRVAPAESPAGDQVTPASQGRKKRKAPPPSRVKAVVSLRIPLDQVVLQPQAGAHHGFFTVFVAARDKEGRLTPVRKTSVPVMIPDAELEEGRTYLYDIEMTMRPGEHDLSIAVLDEMAGTRSFLLESADFQVQ